MVRKENNNIVKKSEIEKLLDVFSENGLHIKELNEEKIKDLMDVGLVSAAPLSFYDMANEDRIHSIYPKESIFAAKVSALWQKEGWDADVWNSLIKAINDSRKTTLCQFIYALEIPSIDVTIAKQLAAYCNDNICEFTALLLETATGYQKVVSQLMTIKGIGSAEAQNIAYDMQLTACERNEFYYYDCFVNELEFASAHMTRSCVQIMMETFDTNWIYYNGKYYEGQKENAVDDVYEQIHEDESKVKIIGEIPATMLAAVRTLI